MTISNECNIKVFCRFRPFNNAELLQGTISPFIQKSSDIIIHDVQF